MREPTTPDQTKGSDHPLLPIEFGTRKNRRGVPSFFGVKFGQVRGIAKAKIYDNTLFAL
jgi:hypothetical protein